MIKDYPKVLRGWLKHRPMTLMYEEGKKGCGHMFILFCFFSTFPPAMYLLRLMQEMKKAWVPSLGWEDPLEEKMAMHCMENPMDRGAWWATVHGVTKNRTWVSTVCQVLTLLYEINENKMIGKTKHIHLKMISVTLNVIYGNNICFKTMYSIYTCLYIYVCECLFTKNVNIFTKNAIYIYTHTHIYIYFAMLCSHIHAYTFYAVVVHSVMSGSLRPHGL